eukprot:TRINITY_DN7107_c0_g1_i3.p1 TRINITY_DN7107_c0_g1~~TRINITY_DN7107_c0_g1_i3.p1  ORF type:complete len:411 (-),score=53.34 TRINITY_DN7107_c0_g1_i3:461-1693(-)
MEKINYYQEFIPNINQYDALGFDIDMCLVRYKVIPITKLTYKAFMSTLISEKNYPKELLELTDDDMAISLNYCILDLKNGNLLKLDEDKNVLKAYHGYKQLTTSQIIQCYGKPPRCNDYQVATGRHQGNYFTSITFLENVSTIMFAKIIQWNMQNNAKMNQPSENIDYVKIYNDISFCFFQNYRHYDNQIVHPIKQYGNYFKVVANETDKLLHKMDKFKQFLIKLKQLNKTLFIISNSHFEYVNLTMSFAYGENWLDLFDFVIIKSGKPDFFSTNKVPLVLLDKSKDNLMGKTVSEITKENKVYLEGNYSYVDRYLQSLKKQGRILFFGDNLLSDCFCAQQNLNWHSVGIVEEISERVEKRDEKHEILVDYPKYWGSFMFDLDEEGKQKKQLLVQLLQRKYQIHNACHRQ